MRDGGLGVGWCGYLAVSKKRSRPLTQIRPWNSLLDTGNQARKREVLMHTLLSLEQELLHG
jgi:hypothetical protein